eukprot:GSChrysophyteH1.ASY1.ANO1.2683.1 assembled CDS
MDDSSRIPAPCEESYEVPRECYIAICLNISCTLLGIAIYSNRVRANGCLMLDCIPVSLEGVEELMFTIKMAHAPTIWLIHPKIVSNSPLLEVILSSPIDNSPHFYRYHSPKSSLWHHREAMELICTKLRIRNIVESANFMTSVAVDSKLDSGKSNYDRVASVVNLENVELCRAAGALLGYMARNGYIDSSGVIEVDSLETISVNSIMKIDAESITALSIFIRETHPNILKGKGLSKEGMSLFALLDRTRSAPGRARLKEWMNCPQTNADAINERLNGVELFWRESNNAWAAQISKHIKHNYDIPAYLIRVKKAEARFADWLNFLTAAAAALEVSDYVEAFVESAELSQKLWSQVNLPLLAENTRHLNSVIDVEGSKIAGDLCVREGYDTELDRLQHIYNRLEFTLHNAAQQILQDYPTLQRVGVEYLPQVGFLVSIEGSHDMNAVTVPPFDLVYTTDEQNFYRTALTREMDVHIGDIRHTVQDRQREIFVQWCELANCVATLDATMSLGIIARERDFSRPEVTSESIIAIKGGRHPLQELTVETYIANDTYLDPSRNVAVITGPNSSGKSVYLKQIGLIVYMTHIGSFVSAQKAKIGLCDKILTRISSVESNVTPQSAFTIELSQMSRLLKSHTNRSLCLIDEFGKGTSPVDALSLLASTIEHFCDKKQKCRSVFALHYSEMSVHLPETRGTDDDEEAVPLFKLELGVSQNSYGLQCAKQAGVSEDLVNRAYVVRASLERGEMIRPMNMAPNQRPVLDKAAHQRLLKRFLSVHDWNDEEEAPVEALLELKQMIASAIAGSD